MELDATVVVPTLAGGQRLERMLASLDDGGELPEVVVVDDGSPAGVGVTDTVARFPFARVLRLERNAGYSAAVNAGARAAAGGSLVLLNDDCVCEPGFVRAIVEPLDPAAGLVMVAGAMRDARQPALIETAGIELDQTLLAFDYLNGGPVSALAGAADPFGPSGAAAAFDRDAFLDAGGFDEAIFAYLEDVDLAIRMRLDGARCALAPAAIGTHEHSATLGSGSPRKNELMGFGRGYLLRKWGVVTFQRLPGLVAREATVCLGQAAFDRNLAGMRGRARGWRAAGTAVPRAYPGRALTGFEPPGSAQTLARRLARRRRLRDGRAAVLPRGGEGSDRERPTDAVDGWRGGSAPGKVSATDAPRRSMIIFHVAGPSGAARSLERPAGWLAEASSLDVLTPGPGFVAERYRGVARAVAMDYEPLVLPRSPSQVVGWVRGLRAQVQAFRAAIRERRPELVVVATAMLPAPLLAARLESVPAVLHADELLTSGRSAGRRLLGRVLTRLAGSLAASVAACSQRVAHQYRHAAAPLAVIHPPIADPGGMDGSERRRAIGVEAHDPLVVAVGALTAMRGQHVLLEAFAGIHAARPGARLVIVGEPFPRPADLGFAAHLRHRATELGLGEAVRFSSFEHELDDLYAAADVVVNPALDPEAFGRVACEALAAGTPVVSSRVGAVSEVLRDGRTALLVPPGDPDALAQAVERLLDDSDLAARLATAGREDVLARFGADRALAGFQALVAATVGDGAALRPRGRNA